MELVFELDNQYSAFLKHGPMYICKLKKNYLVSKKSNHWQKLV